MDLTWRFLSSLAFNSLLFQNWDLKFLRNKIRTNIKQKNKKESKINLKILGCLPKSVCLSSLVGLYFYCSQSVWRVVKGAVGFLLYGFSLKVRLQPLPIDFECTWDFTPHFYSSMQEDLGYLKGSGPSWSQLPWKEF